MTHPKVTRRQKNISRLLRDRKQALKSKISLSKRKK